MNLSAWEMMTLLIIALLIFGPDKLPGLARGAGRMISRFKAEASGALDELKLAGEFEEVKGVAADLRGTRDELRGTRDELRRSAGLAQSAAAGAVGAASAKASQLEREDPPPFDAEAT